MGVTEGLGNIVASSASLVVVSPVWRSSLTSDEFDRLAESARNSPKAHHLIIHPAGLDTTILKKGAKEWNFKAFPAEHFQSVNSYSNWLMTEDFYRSFINYEYLTICQTDAVLLRQWPVWCQDFDYIGAPWEPPWRVWVVGGEMRIVRLGKWAIGRTLHVGNGGLSLRRVESFLRACSPLERLAPANVRNRSNEDAVWSYFRKELGLSFCTRELAQSALLDLRIDQRVVPSQWVGIHGLKVTTPLANADVREWISRIP